MKTGQFADDLRPGIIGCGCVELVCDEVLKEIVSWS
jgi:hypothetical protein